ncbi:ribosome hibernation-promoting factor, HPF/YfiA family [Sphingomonas mesophila]|uniref:ribosome hibernation-promoting factor, HPF/YfiA family n=1 Tax=Sphingomonas mesophila TaxID=2303576 RepID=UPI000E56830C|nr:ribosome-associated translation inhibitor RaiA [Sphingomonas mesophila]
MNVRVAGHQVETGSALQSHVTTRITALADKYFGREIGATVTFGRGPHDDFTCDIVAPVTGGVVLKSANRAGDAHIAFDGAADKIERQLSRYMDRLREHKHNGADTYVENAEYRVFEAPAEVAPPPQHPPIVAETRVDIPTATVGDAVMMLDLRNTNALMFRNAASDAFNMVYRRDDGTIGWVEPRGE